MGKTRLHSFQVPPFLHRCLILFLPVEKPSSQPSALPATGPGPVPGALLPPSGARQLDPPVVWSQSASITLNFLDCEILEHYQTAGSLAVLDILSRQNQGELVFIFLTYIAFSAILCPGYSVIFKFQYILKLKHVSSHFRY